MVRMCENSRSIITLERGKIRACRVSENNQNMTWRMAFTQISIFGFVFVLYQVIATDKEILLNVIMAKSLGVMLVF